MAFLIEIGNILAEHNRFNEQAAVEETTAFHQDTSDELASLLRNCSVLLEVGKLIDDCETERSGAGIRGGGPYGGDCQSVSCCMSDTTVTGANRALLIPNRTAVDKWALEQCEAGVCGRKAAVQGRPQGGIQGGPAYLAGICGAGAGDGRPPSGCLQPHKQCCCVQWHKGAFNPSTPVHTTNENSGRPDHEESGTRDNGQQK